MSVPKVHLIDNKENPNDWKQSPHIESAIREKLFTVCHIIQYDERLTTDTNKITCVRCKEIHSQIN